MTKDRARWKAAQYLAWADAAEVKSKAMYASFKDSYRDFDWTQPILKGHHSQRRHERVFEHRDCVMRTTTELDAKAKRMREKAENLLSFANTNKGDAEARRIEARAAADELYTAGSNIIDPVFGEGVVLRVNKKTYSVRFTSGFTTTRDKSFFVKRRRAA